MATSWTILQRSWSSRLLTVSFSVCLLQLMVLRPCTGDDYYVTPSTDHSDCPNVNRPCKTLDEYSRGMYLNRSASEIVMLFLEGSHRLTARDLEIVHFTEVHLKPESPTAGNTAVKIHLLCYNMTFGSMSRLTLENLTISSTCKTSPYIVSHSNAKATFQNLYVTGVSMSVSVDGGDETSFVLKESCGEQSSNTGLFVKSLGRLDISVEKTTLSDHQQGGIIVDSSGTSLSVTITDTIIENNNISSIVSAVDAAGLAVYSTQSQRGIVQILRSRFLNNNDLRGDPVTVYASRMLTVIIEECEFNSNRGTAVKAVNIQQNVRLRGNTTFYYNSGRQGGALALTGTLVYFQQLSHVSFVSNIADDVGGAIFVDAPSFLYDENDRNTIAKCFYQFDQWEDDGRDPNEDYTSITFEGNFARNGGHHIYGSSLKSYCVVYRLSEYSPDNVKRSINDDIQRLFHFDHQVVSPVSSNPTRVCLMDKLSSNQSFVDDCTNLSQIFASHEAIPGEEFDLEAVLVGAQCGTGTGAVYAQFLPNSNGSEANLQPSYQHSQRVNSTNETQSLKYAVYSNNSYEMLVLTATDGTILTDGVKGQIENAIEEYKSTKVLPAILLTTPVYINVTLLDCPSGFYHDPSTMGCTCNPQLCNSPQVTGKLNNRMGFINVTGNIWVNTYDNDNVSGVILHNNCPFDFCNTSGPVLINLDNPNTQCAANRGHVLCGRCVNGSSLAIGSNECLHCHNNNGLALLIFFVAAGFLLVFFIKVLNLTVSQGTINGLIFYANIIWAYQNIFFSNVVGETQLSYTFIAWINLDFGIETCFVEGLTAFWKTWLQFLFPLYVWCIAGVIILLAHYSERMTKLFGKNSVHVLATLFLLSYAKLLRTIIAVLFPATLYVYNERGDLVKSQTRVVWALDGNLVYGRFPHIFLLLFVLLIVIPLWLFYTLVFLFISPLRRFSDRWCFKWVNKLVPFLEAYVGPLTAPNQHWVGLLLLARFILLVIFTFTYASNPNSSLLALVVVVVFLLSGFSYTGRLYNDNQPANARFFPEKILKYRSIFETSFLFNLAVVGVSVLYVRLDGGSQEAIRIIITVSTGIAFVQFIGIVLLHLYCAIKNKICRPSSSDDSMNMTEYQDLDEESDTATPPTTTTLVMMDSKASSSGARSNEHYSQLQKSYESARFREPLLTESIA